MSVGSKWNRTGAVGKGLTDADCEKAYNEMVAAIADLRPINKDDPYMLDEEDTLIKFLTARKYVAADAEKMLRGYLAWRKEYGMHDIFVAPNLPPAFGELSQLGFGGRDRDGHPVYLDAPSGKDLLELVKAYPWEVLLRWHVYVVERERQVLQRWGKGQITIVFDVKGVSTSCYTSTSILSAMKKLAAHDQDMYPEIMRYIFVINAPMAAAGVWKVMSPFLDPVVREKVHIWSPKEWKAEISKYIDLDCLSEKVGGNSTDWFPIKPDPASFVMPPPP